MTNGKRYWEEVEGGTPVGTRPLGDPTWADAYADAVAREVERLEAMGADR